MAGEGAVSTASALVDLPDDWTVLCDLAWPSKRHPDIGHIAVGPPGIFVIADAEPGTDRTAAIRAAVAAAATVSGLAPSVRFDHVHGVLSYEAQGLPGEWVEGVLVVSARHLADELASYADVLPGSVSRVVAADVQRQLDATRGVASTRSPRPTWLEEHSRRRAAGVASRAPITAGALLRVATGVALALTFLAQPQVFASMVTGVADFVVEQVEADETQPSDPQRDKRLRDKRQEQRQAR